MVTWRIWWTRGGGGDTAHAVDVREVVVTQVLVRAGRG